MKSFGRSELFDLKCGPMGLPAMASRDVKQFFASNMPPLNETAFRW